MNIPKISVICPVYKAEKYLHRCVDSILAQTFTDFELLLIDDGSPDRSGEICDEYAAKDSRVRVFHKENGGVSSARQCGIDNMTGEYSIHSDPDDWVEPTMLEELYKKAKEEDADMVICDYKKIFKDREVYVHSKAKNNNIENIKAILSGEMHGSCWNKLVRNSLYREHEIQFSIGIVIREDLLVIVELLCFVKSISVCNKAFYYYNCINEDSVVHARNLNTKNILKTINLIDDVISRHNLEITLYIDFLYFKSLTLGAVLLKGDATYLDRSKFSSIPYGIIISHPNAPFHYKLVCILYKLHLSFLTYLLRTIYRRVIK
ncbi:MAG: glycosyltransferase [Bacteroidaceae bacterium]